MRRTTLLATGIVPLALLLAGCGSSGDGGDQAATPTTAAADAGDTSTDRTTGSTPASGADGDTADAGAAGEGPCTVVTAELLEEAFPGAAFEEPVPTKGERAIDDVEWVTVACRWKSDTVTVRAAVAGEEGFADGFVCAEPTGGVSEEGPVPVADLGEQAWWTWDDFTGPNANLAVCDGERRVDVDVDAPNGSDLTSDAALEGATLIARALL